MQLERISFYANVAAVVVILCCWAIFVWTLLRRRGSSSSSHSGREPLSWIGLGLQLLSYPVSWSVWRFPLFSPVVPDQYLLNTFIQAMASAIAAWSAWLAVAAIRELGKQWSLQARVLEDHSLITTGVYSMVRHPMYTAMLGMLIASGLAISHWLALSAGVVVFLAGTKIRIHLEEKLLAEVFGTRFMAWKAKVPGLLPRRLF